MAFEKAADTWLAFDTKKRSPSPRGTTCFITAAPPRSSVCEAPCPPSKVTADPARALVEVRLGGGLVPRRAPERAVAVGRRHLLMAGHQLAIEEPRGEPERAFETSAADGSRHAHEGSWRPAQGVCSWVRGSHPSAPQGQHLLSLRGVASVDLKRHAIDRGAKG